MSLLSDGASTFRQAVHPAGSDGPRRADRMPQMKHFNAQLIEEFRQNGGVVTGQFADRLFLLLTTRERRTGLSRTTALACCMIGDRLVVVGPKGGNPNHPDWY